MRRCILALGAACIVVGASPFAPHAHAETAGEYIVQFVDGTDPHAEAARLEGDGVDVGATYEHVFPGVAITATPSEIAALARDGDVEAVSSDSMMYASEQAQDVEATAVQAGAPWGLDRIDQRDLPLSTTYDPPSTGAGVKVYVLDSGININHTEFTGRIGPGAYAYGGSVADCNGHGTHVSGIAGGTTYGVAKSVTIIPVKVLSCTGSAPTSLVMAGLDFVIEDHEAGEPAVLNASLGGDANSSVDAAVQAAIDDGITVVIAAGNGAAPGSGLPTGTPLDACTQSPARLPTAITVGATTASDTMAPFSNYGTCVDVQAPGVSITSAGILDNTSTAVMSGTSMAAPHVAGVAALLLAQQPSLTPAQVSDLLVGDASVGKIANPGVCTTNRLLYTALDDGVPPPTFNPVLPARLLETRPGLATVDGRYNSIGPIPAGGTVSMDTCGRGGVDADASGIALNVTVVNPSAAGFVTVFPCGSAVPNSSSVNFAAGATVANAVITKIGTNKQVCFYSNVTTDLVVDVNGYVPAGSTFTPLAPSRYLDTRPGLSTFDGQYMGNGAIPASGTLQLAVAGRGSVPIDAGAVVANVTVVHPTAAGFVTVFPCGSAVPNSSSVNFAAGATVANAVVAKLGAAGRMCLYSNVATDVVVDVNGYFPAVSGFQPVLPSRLLDTRPGLTTVDGTFAGQGQVASGAITQLAVTGRAGIAADATAVVLNVTAVEPTASGFITVYPCSSGVPNSSSLNFAAGATVANAVVARVGASGAVCLFSNVATDLVVDVTGWFTPT
ncbi:MAG: S8 family peptidase [Ilumatobacteraceae bacterium]